MVVELLQLLVDFGSPAVDQDITDQMVVEDPVEGAATQALLDLKHLV